MASVDANQAACQDAHYRRNVSARAVMTRNKPLHQRVLLPGPQAHVKKEAHHG